MNGSRSNTPNHGGKSSLDQLNRTIEGLEARINGLMGERQQPRTVSANPLDEILERQRSLAARERVSSVRERLIDPARNDLTLADTQRAPAPRPEPKRAETPLDSWDRPAPRVSKADPALAEIAATLTALRNDLHKGIGPGLQHGLDDLRTEMRGLKAATLSVPGMGVESLRADLAQLGTALQKLEGTGRDADAAYLRQDIEDLRAMLGEVAREDSLRGLEARFARTEEALSGFSADDLKEELVQLAWRIDGIKSGLGEMSAAPAVRALEEKLIAVANAVENIGRGMQGQTAIVAQFSGLDHRLDEISRAIAASARQPGSVLDTSTLQRLESRIDDLVDHVGALPQVTQSDALGERIEALTERVEELANEEAYRNLEERIAHLSTTVERNFREAVSPAVFNDHLEDISRKIDGLGATGSDALLARLDLLVRKVDAIEQPAPGVLHASSDPVAFSRLETRLADIAARLDESAAAPATDIAALANLERQIANLSALLDRPSASQPGGALPEALGERMSAIEDYIASSDEFIVEAARQAAETVVEAYSRNRMDQTSGVSAGELAALSGLAEDLRALEAQTRSSEERTQATFEALHETLVQIAGRLNELGNLPAPQPVQAAQSEPVRETNQRLRESVAMPRATQPQFADIDLSAGNAAPRRAPDNVKVAVLDEAELMASVAQKPDDMVAAEQAPLVPPAAPKASRSLIAGLAARLKPAKKDVVARKGRVSVEPTPSIDPGEAVAASEPNLLLEPGTGVPDVKKILEKVRNGQRNDRRDHGQAAPAGDVIAAARRAAQAAAAEAGAQKLSYPVTKEKQPSRSLLAGMGDNRRPILLAAAAVLLVVMSYPLVSNLIGGRSAETNVPETSQEQVIDKPAESSAAETRVLPEENAAAVTGPDEIPAATSVVADAPDTPMDDVEGTQASETAADTIMAPPETTSQAAQFVKPAGTLPDEAGSGTLASADPLPQANAPAAKAADSVQPDAAPAATQEITVPAGLQPAALVEAVKKGDALALFEIGARYTDGRSVKVDLAEAAKWYALAAEKGNAPAQYRLANFYEKGTGVARDIDRARTLYKSAAEKGNASAMHNLAVLYATGVGGTPDFAEAARWFTQAADLNVRDSQFNLAILFARGNGVAQDLEETYKWFAIAAREGDQDAAQKRDEVANALSADQLKSAKAKLDLWKPKALDDAANTPMVPDAWLAKGNTTASVDMRRAIRNIQAILNNNGFDAGKPDGEMGNKTVAAIKAFQKSVGQDPSGRIDDALVKELLKRNKPKS